MIKQYRKKPIIITALQWTGDNLEEVVSFLEPHTNASAYPWEEFITKCGREGLTIYTLRGPVTASIGDYIIKGKDGLFYTCTGPDFESEYEEVP